MVREWAALPEDPSPGPVHSSHVTAYMAPDVCIIHQHPYTHKKVKLKNYWYLVRLSERKCECGTYLVSGEGPHNSDRLYHEEA